MWRRALLLPLLLATLAACGTAGSPTASSVTTANHPHTAVASGPPPDRRLRFGEEYQAKDGISFSLSDPMPYAPSVTALKGQEARYVRFTFSLTNGTSSPLNPEAFLISATAEGTLLRRVVDRDNDVGIPRHQPLPPGGEITRTIAFGLPAHPTVISVEIDPVAGTSGTDAAYFVGEV